MLNPTDLTAEPVRMASVPAPGDSIRLTATGHGDASVARRIADTLQQVEDALAPQRRVVHAGDPIYRAGDPFGNLYLLNSGLVEGGRPLGRRPRAGGRPEVSRRLARLRRHRERAVRLRCRCDGHRRGLGDPLRRVAGGVPVRARAADLAARRDEPRDRARPRLPDVGLHACRPMRASPTSCATGPSRCARAACAPTRSRCA